MTGENIRSAWKEMAIDRKFGQLHSPDEIFEFYPEILPDNRARGFVNEGGHWLSNEEKGGKDLFGVEWVYVPSAGGSMEKPGVPCLLEDANDWQQVIQWPDVDAWDWKGSGERNKKILQSGKVNYIPLLNGFGFERLASFMGFENALVALIDDEQTDAVKALLDRLADLACRIIELCCTHFDIDGFLIHDDWGSQRDAFFSQQVGEELFVPAMQKITACIHAHGKVAELHSCGCLGRHIGNFVEGGWDIWHPMTNINDTMALFKTYGDRIVLGVSPENEAGIPDTEESARAFAEDICADQRKVCVLSRYFVSRMSDTYKKALNTAFGEICHNY